MATYHNNNDVRLDSRPRPQIGPGELLLRVEASGLCGSDTMEWYRVPQAPLVLGHEVAGIIEEVGAGVEAFAVGDRIVTTHHVPCGNCRYCLTGRSTACRILHRTRFEPGGFSELIRLPSINVERGTFRLPDGVSFEQGSFVEPLACVLRAQNHVRLNPGDSVVVLGSGVSGILHIQAARANGAECVVATDVNPARLAAATRFGADAAVAADGDVVTALREHNNGRLAELVIVCTGAKPAFEQSLQLVDDGGTILYFAPLAPGEPFALPANELWKRGISLMHSYAGPPDAMRLALDWIEAGKVDVSSMITHRLPLERTGEGFRLMVDGGAALKIMIEPQR